MSLREEIECSEWFDPHEKVTTVADLVKALMKLPQDAKLIKETVVGTWQDDETVSVFEID